MHDLPSDQYAIWAQLIVAVNVPCVVGSTAAVCSALQPVATSVVDSYRINLSQQSANCLMRHDHLVLSS